VLFEEMPQRHEQLRSVSDATLVELAATCLSTPSHSLVSLFFSIWRSALALVTLNS
jgi:hypothetical protein